MNKKKFFGLLFSILILSFLLAACGGNDKDGKSKETNENGENGKGSSDEQVLNMNIRSEPPSLHPGLATDTTSTAVLNQIFEGLTRINQDGVVEEAMAEKIDVSDDQTTYTFTIRDGATWSNGDPVTAGDFEYAWKWVLDPDNADTDYAYQLYYLKNGEAAKNGEVSTEEVGVKAKDDKTLIVELEQPTPYFLDLTAFHTYYPVNQKVVENAPDWSLDVSDDYVTNGPFLLDSWKHKDQVVIKKNPEYWDADTVSLETINFYMIEDENTELNMYNNGELDWAGSPNGSLPLSAIPSLMDSGELNISPQAGVYYYVFNLKEAPFDNVNIRKAFTLAIDREGIVQNITKGEQQPAMAFVPPSIWEENQTGYFEDKDIDKAKEYLEKGLKELGLDELPTIKLSYNTSESHAALAQAVQEMWRENLGVDVELDNTEWNVFLDKMTNGDFQTGRMGWSADFNDAINFLETFRTLGGSNFSQWVDDEYTALLDESRTETDATKRKEILRDAEQILMDAMPIAPVYFYTNVWINKDYVKDVAVTALGGIQFKWGSIEK